MKLGMVFENGLLKVANIILEKLTAKEVTAEKLCVGQTCITEEELKALLEKSGIQTSQNPIPRQAPSRHKALAGKQDLRLRFWQPRSPRRVMNNE